ncbi:nuclear transport factor 2 family protein [Roseateles chitinivorans]|uniref:nuclear transport factor 2 family protein n=1 Tax=Roseateles chitinivorans TaxID=2917965 RepID=UPI003D6791E8
MTSTRLVSAVMTGAVIASLAMAIPAARAATAPAKAQASNAGSPAGTDTAANKTAVDTMLRRWMGGDYGALQPMLADDIEWTIAGNSLVAGTTRSRDELNRTVLGPFGARFAQSQDRFRPRTIHAVYADGDTVVAHFSAAGTTNAGKPYANSYVWMLTMRDGKAVRVTAFFDSIAFDEFWRQNPVPAN